MKSSKNKNLAPASSEATLKSPEQLELVAAASSEPATPVKSSVSSRSRKKGAKAASTTKQNPQRNKIAQFILYKYVKTENILYSRDMPFAYKLADRHPDLEFWAKMPVKRQIDTLIILWSQESRNRLTRAWDEYQKMLKIQRSIILDTPAIKYIIGDKVGEDYVPAPKRPKSVLEFCR